MRPKVAIIILNWNNKADTLDCLRSLQGIDYPAYETIVVDNGSMDDSVSAIKLQYPGLALVETKKNLGFAGGNNEGIKLALQKDADYVLLLNNDTVVDSKFLDRLVDAAERSPDAGIVGPKIYYFKEPDRIWFAGGKINYRSGNTSHIGELELDEGQYDEVRDTDFITGCAMLIRRKVLDDIGFLDDRMFLYYEDSDFCARAHRHGYRIRFVPSSRIWHKVSSTASKVKDIQFYYGTRNMILFEKHNARPLDLMLFVPYYLVKFVAYNALAAALSLNFSRVKMILKAAYEGITG
jgi:GT2 family glycosyltransferase